MGLARAVLAQQRHLLGLRKAAPAAAADLLPRPRRRLADLLCAALLCTVLLRTARERRRRLRHVDGTPTCACGASACTGATYGQTLRAGLTLRHACALGTHHNSVGSDRPAMARSRCRCRRATRTCRRRAAGGGGGGRDDDLCAAPALAEYVLVMLSPACPRRITSSQHVPHDLGAARITPKRTLAADLHCIALSTCNGVIDIFTSSSARASRRLWSSAVQRRPARRGGGTRIDWGHTPAHALP